MEDASRQLARLRGEVDTLDGELGDLLARRFALTEEIGRLKAIVSEAPLDARRQRARREVLAAIALRCGLPPGMWEEIHRALRTEVVRRHARHSP